MIKIRVIDEHQGSGTRIGDQNQTSASGLNDQNQLIGLRIKYHGQGLRPREGIVFHLIDQ